MFKKVLSFLAVAVFATTTLAAPVSASSLRDGMQKAKPDGVNEELMGDGGIFTNVVNVMLFVIGAISVIMLIWGGIQYTISRGDSGAVNNAKNTILYALVGLVLAIFAYAIVNFVVGRALGDEL